MKLAGFVLQPKTKMLKVQTWFLPFQPHWQVLMTDHMFQLLWQIKMIKKKLLTSSLKWHRLVMLPMVHLDARSNHSASSLLRVGMTSLSLEFLMVAIWKA
jgi:hypothetical protein